MLKELEPVGPCRADDHRATVQNLAELAPPATELQPAEETELPPVRIEHLAITRGRVGLEDHTNLQTFFAAVSPITFTLRNFRTDAGHQNPYQFPERQRPASSSNGRVTSRCSRSDRRAVSHASAEADDDRLYLYESLPFKLARATSMSTVVMRSA